MRVPFDFEWKFIKEDVVRAEAPGFDDSAWETIDLPHDFSIAGPIDENNPSGKGGGFFPGGIGWYRKTFPLPDGAAGKSVFLEFDGVFWKSEVWINGRRLGFRPNGYIGFQYELTPHLNRSGPNVVAVRVDNSEQPNHRWYSGSGICRHVWFDVLAPVHVAHWGVYVWTPKVTNESASVRVRTLVENQSERNRRVALASTILDGGGARIATVEWSRDAPAGSVVEVDQDLEIADPALWSPETPTLYTLLTRVMEGDAVLDERRTPFGVRHCEFHADKGFFLNGRNMKMRGMCLHHDGGGVGAAVPERVWERRLEILKAMGCNAIRTSHNPYAPEFLDLCDRMGLLVIDEIFDEWHKPKREFSYARYFDEWWRRDLTDQVLRDRNHPCVILWSIGNEIPEKGTAEGAATARMLVEAIHALEPTRPVTAGVNTIAAANRSGYADALDVVGYNEGGDSVFQYAEDHLVYPARKMYASEAPHTFATRGVYHTHSRHREEAGEAWRKMRTQEVPHLTPHEVFPWFHDAYHSNYDNAYVRICTRDTWRLVAENDFMAGEFRWTGFDYQGESHSWPAKSSNAGAIDLCGFPKDIYYFYQSRWTAEPMVHILPHWTWPEIHKGTIIPAWAYSNCDTVELFLNGRSLGEQAMGNNYHLSWDVPYEPGAIKAVAKKDGRIVCEDEQRTAGPPARIELTADRETLAADGRDVVHLTARLLDAEGVFCPTTTNRIVFQVEGPARLLALENGDPIDHQSSKDGNRKAFAGMCLAIVQSKRRAGAIRVKAGSEGLAGAEVQIRALLPSAGP
ncbi:MAG: DUF4982 domain-containing protein [Candidatus Sumerlaeota bacterium]|nr:DUF4982 domain-containing protein [Candidatus Sumerlaeota bacterium]